jgi:hypothetical protein
MNDVTGFVAVVGPRPPRGNPGGEPDVTRS